MFFFGLVPTYSSAQNQPNTFVGLKSGKVLYPESIALRERGFGGSYLILDGRDQVLLSDILFFQNQDGYFIYEPIEGANRSSLMRREFQGRITLFTITRVVYNTNFDPYRTNNFRNNGSSRERTEYYFRKDNGIVQRYNYRNLRIALSDNPESLAILQEVGRRRFLMYSLYGAGGAIAVYSMLQTLQDGTIPLSTWLGVGLLTVPTFLGSGIDAKMEQALLLYNKSY
ncbi:MAG TPA: hypothetical protein DCE41_13025 [Cytophagales bacterium]|nr:hypothetical protein [Cytophagales bacterium]HAA18379.1 hypothetical protein [Cytophagales bacterium]HAP61427.1 hypothetical protein [Cytophagales bacterium]